MKRKKNKRHEEKAILQKLSNALADKKKYAHTHTYTLKPTPEQASVSEVNQLK